MPQTLWLKLFPPLRVYPIFALKLSQLLYQHSEEMTLSRFMQGDLPHLQGACEGPRRGAIHSA